MVFLQLDVLAPRLKVINAGGVERPIRFDCGFRHFQTEGVIRQFNNGVPERFEFFRQFRQPSFVPFAFLNPSGLNLAAHRGVRNVQFRRPFKDGKEPGEGAPVGDAYRDDTKIDGGGIFFPADRYQGACRLQQPSRLGARLRGWASGRPKDDCG